MNILIRSLNFIHEMSKEWKFFVSIAGVGIALYSIYFGLFFPSFWLYYKILCFYILLFLVIIITLIRFSWRLHNRQRIIALPKIEFRFLSIKNHPFTGKKMYIFQALPKKSLKYLSPGLFFELIEMQEKIEQSVGFLKIVHLQPSGLIQAVSVYTPSSSIPLTRRIKGRPIFWHLQRNTIDIKNPYQRWLCLSSWMQSHLDFHKILEEVNHVEFRG